MQRLPGRDIGVSGPVRHEGPMLYTNSWALVAGFDHYQDTRIPTLQYAEADAHAIAALLPDLGFPRQNITVFAGSRDRVTPHTFLDFLKDTLDPEMKTTDRLLVYIAGHGVSTHINGEYRGHLLMPGSEITGNWPSPENPHLERNPKRALEMKQLLDVIRGLHPHHRLLLMDACFSGYAARTIERTGPVAADDPRIEKWLSAPVTQVLTAGRSGQKAFESPVYRHGVFTHYVLQALEGHADREARGLITFSQFASYVRDRVAGEETDQDPQSDCYGEGEYLLMVSPVRQQAQDELAPAEAERGAQADAQRRADELERRRPADLAPQQAGRRSSTLGPSPGYRIKVFLGGSLACLGPTALIILLMTMNSFSVLMAVLTICAFPVWLVAVLWGINHDPHNIFSIMIASWLIVAVGLGVIIFGWILGYRTAGSTARTATLLASNGVAGVLGLIRAYRA